MLPHCLFLQHYYCGTCFYILSAPVHLFQSMSLFCMLLQYQYVVYYHLISIHCGCVHSLFVMLSFYLSDLHVYFSTFLIIYCCHSYWAVFLSTAWIHQVFLIPSVYFKGFSIFSHSYLLSPTNIALFWCEMYVHKCLSALHQFFSFLPCQFLWSWHLSIQCFSYGQIMGFINPPPLQWMSLPFNH